MSPTFRSREWLAWNVDRDRGAFERNENRQPNYNRFSLSVIT